MKISVSNQELYFSAFYIISFLLPAAVVVISCIRRRIPFRNILLLLTALSLLTIIGSRLFTVPVSDWGRIVATGSFDGYPGRSAVGGMLFGVAGLVILQGFLGIGPRVLNLYAWLAPLGFGIQKIGCFLNGCCYGTPSALPWSVRYPIGTNAHHFQWIHSIIGETEAYSQPVHPVQIYEAIILFSIAFIVWRTRNYWKRNGSILLNALCMFFLCRFAVEFLRDPSATYFLRSEIWGIREFQWLMLFTGVIFGALLFMNEKARISIVSDKPLQEPSRAHLLIFIVSLSIAAFFFRGLFTRFEMISLDIKFIPAILLTAVYLLKNFSFSRIPLVTASFLALPVLILSQALPQDTSKGKTPISQFYNDSVKTYMKVDVGTTFGTAFNEVLYNPHEGYCGTAYSSADYKHEFRMTGATLSWVKQEGKATTTMGLGLFGGVDKEFDLAAGTHKTYDIFGAKAFYKYDINWIGIGVGVNAGNLRWIPYAPIDGPYIISSTSRFPLMPEGYFRVGRRDIIDLRYDFGTKLASTYPVLLHEFSIGSGFGFRNDAGLRFGMDIALSNRSGISPNYFISAAALLSKNFGMTVRFDYGNEFNYNQPVNQGSWLSLGASYRFGFNK